MLVADRLKAVSKSRRWSEVDHESTLRFVPSTCVTDKLVLATNCLRKQEFAKETLTGHPGTQTMCHVSCALKTNIHIYKDGPGRGSISRLPPMDTS